MKKYIPLMFVTLLSISCLNIRAEEIETNNEPVTASEEQPAARKKKTRSFAQAHKEWKQEQKKKKVLRALKKALAKFPDLSA